MKPATMLAQKPRTGFRCSSAILLPLNFALAALVFLARAPLFACPSALMASPSTSASSISSLLRLPAVALSRIALAAAVNLTNRVASCTTKLNVDSTS